VDFLKQKHPEFTGALFLLVSQPNQSLSCIMQQHPQNAKVAHKEKTDILDIIGPQKN
jgi:hypothetical protein